MARPRRPFGGQEDIVPSGDRWLKSLLAAPLGVRQETRWESSTHWVYRSVNGQYDPLTYLHILDAVANLDPSIELRAKKLAEWLNGTVTGFIWDPVTVGKVLSDLSDAFTDVLGAGNGLLERGKDYRGHFFYVHHTPEVANLYSAVREDLMRLVQDEMAQRVNRIRSQRLVSPLLECPSMRGEFVA
jgi:hypothetical protein